MNQGMEITRLLALGNLPTKERYEKGDVVIHGLDDYRGTAYPTARASWRRKFRINELEDRGVIDCDQRADCAKFNRYYLSATVERGVSAIDYSMERVDGNVYLDMNPEEMTNAGRYYWLVKRMSKAANMWLNLVVCREKSLSEARSFIGGDTHTAKARLHDSIAELHDRLRELSDVEKSACNFFLTITPKKW